MPIYEYQCRACGHQLEALQRISDAPLTDCPACDKADLQKKISAAGFRLKGGGWYETDFKTGSKKNLAGDSAKPQSAKSGTDKPAGGSAAAG
ncbi:zinc ribbon domain-containing protein [Microbulbifer flavimaris]|uniref:Zinc ribbon domain-containing protein n=1 Tax=Microbulbifer flavimaris TaxID=1781068 RepID=A0ABX4HXP7_9GAMM|nr:MULTISPECIES: zinc ribbon domain-containing protein [Microbulbifer]KUJ82558.1 transcriptional regulator [Microbulbifer sp. ZGT114]PCO04768.1 zinc ribbon domain-containing protein [Microbulbifer flavimaris]